MSKHCGIQSTVCHRLTTIGPRVYTDSMMSSRMVLAVTMIALSLNALSPDLRSSGIVYRSGFCHKCGPNNRATTILNGCQATTTTTKKTNEQPKQKQKTTATKSKCGKFEYFSNIVNRCWLLHPWNYATWNCIIPFVILLSGGERNAMAREKLYEWGRARVDILMHSLDFGDDCFCQIYEILKLECGRACVNWISGKSPKLGVLESIKLVSQWPIIHKL